MNGWATVDLGSLLHLKRGISYGVVQPGNHDPDGIPIVRVSDIRQGQIATSRPLKVKRSIEASFKRTRLCGGELLITVVGTIGETAIVPDSLAGWNIARAVAVVPVRPEVGAYWLQVALRSSTAKHMMHTHLNTTVQPTLNLGVVSKLPIVMPPQKVRERIVSILAAYDDLIEVNRRRVAILEEMARRLFEEWFVHLRFPGHDTVPVHDTPDGPLPEGWRYDAISSAYDDLFDGPHATPDPAEVGPIFLGINNITESGQIDLSSVRHIAEHEFLRWTKRVIPQAGDIVFTYEATLNRYALIPSRFRGCLGRRLALIRANSTPGMNYYLFLCFFTKSWRDLIARNTLSGATVNRIPLTRFPTFRIAIPPAELLLRLQRVAAPIFRAIEMQLQAGQSLAAARDLLLPRLVSGELSVAHAPAPACLFEAAD